MKLRKVLAAALALVMVVAAPVVAKAATTEVDCTGWWVAFSDAYTVDEDGLELTFKNTTYETATANWNGPIYIVYEGTVERAVVRGDLYGWDAKEGTAEEGYELITRADGTTGYDVNTANSNWAKRGYTFERTAEPADWATYLSALKAGADCKVEANIANNVLTVKFTVGDVVSTATYPVSGTEPVTIKLGGELCKLTEITEVVKTPAPAPGDDITPTGDFSMVLPLVLVLMGGAVVIVASKKRFA